MGELQEEHPAACPGCGDTSSHYWAGCAERAGVGMTGAVPIAADDPRIRTQTAWAGSGRPVDSEWQARQMAEHPDLCQDCFREPHWRHAATTPVDTRSGAEESAARERRIAAHQRIAPPPTTGNPGTDLTAVERYIEDLDRVFEVADRDYMGAGGGYDRARRSLYMTPEEQAELSRAERRRDGLLAARELAVARRDRLTAEWERSHNPAAYRLRQETEEVSRWAQTRCNEAANARERALRDGLSSPEEAERGRWAQRRADQAADAAERRRPWEE